MTALRDRLRSKWWIVLGLVLLFGAPDVTRATTQVPLLTVQIGVAFGFAALGVNLLLRHTKLVSFGHAAFFGTGAYAVALLASTNPERLLGAPNVAGFVPLLIAAIIASAAMAAFIGFVSLRHTGLYFSLLTLAFGQLLFSIVNGQNSLLGGSDGLPVRPGEANQVLLFGVDLGSNYSLVMYYISAVLLVGGLYLMYRLANSPFGKALDAIGQDRTRARFIGLPVRRYVWVAFIISGIYAGVGGAVFAFAQKFINPQQTLFFLRSGDILFMAILGGFDTLVGPVVGGVVLEFLLFIGESVARAIFGQNLSALVAGTALLVLVYAFPEGVVGSIQRGGIVREGLSRLVSDPAVVGEWAGRLRDGIVDAVQRSSTNIRVLLFGVK